MTVPVGRAPSLRLAGAAVVLAAGLVVAGCGVPTASDVNQVRPGPGPEQRQLSDGRPPPNADVARTEQEQVENFLQAAAGPPANAVEQVRDYLEESEAESWEPEGPVRVVRVEDSFITPAQDGVEGSSVELTARLVGELHDDGHLAPSASTEQVTYDFRVVTELVGAEDPNAPPRYRIADPPALLLLSADALADPEYYEPYPIYFWHQDRDGLVPDLRWLPTAEAADQQLWRVVQWVLAGPAPGRARLEGLPDGAQHRGTPVWDGESLVVNLNAAAVEDPAGLNDLATQLAWSLFPLRSTPTVLDLRIDDRPVPAVPRPREAPEPVRFAVLDGVVWGYAGESGTGIPEVVTDRINGGIAAAALATDQVDRSRAALVRFRDDGRQHLSVAEARPGAAAVEEPPDLVADQIGQPAWVRPGDRAAGVVAADGELYVFTSTGDAEALAVPGVTGEVAAVAVSPEGRRLALVAGGRLYVSAVRHDPSGISVSAARPLSTEVQDLTGVAFSGPVHLVVVGSTQRGRVQLWQLTVDGAFQRSLLDLQNQEVSGLVAHPDPDQFDVMYEAGGQAYHYQGGSEPRAVRSDDLRNRAGEPPEGEPESPPRAPSFLR